MSLLLKQVCLIALVLTWPEKTTATPEGGHSIEYWQALTRPNAPLPANTSALALAVELAGHLKDEDPVWRDGFAFSLVTDWMRRGLLGPEDMQKLLPLWLELAAQQGPSATLGRSFAVLQLSVAVRLDKRRPYLTENQFASLLHTGLAALEQESDERGWDDKVGWVHFAAHAADLLKGCAGNRHFKETDTERVLSGIATRIARSTVAFAHGEQERLADLLVTLAARPDYVGKPWADFMAKLLSHPESFDDFRPVYPAYAVRRNARALIDALSTRVAASDEASLIPLRGSLHLALQGR